MVEVAAAGSCATSGYKFATHADIEDRPGLHQDLSDLNALTFGQYDAGVAASPSFMAWYTARPGMDPRLCQAVLCGEELVSSLFVTVTRMRLAGKTVACGIIDTVMTHPAHRRRGLARRPVVREAEVLIGAPVGQW
ncbi:MAG: GNAT family N-acetyltransferase [Armatimonadetes bacterium]|nr:GNAT family N-acetyltransferase [Armatimonadota bacterium]